VESLLGRKTTRVVACPCGDRFSAAISETDIVKRAREPGPLRILFLGNVVPNKGLHILLEALKALPENSFQLSVIGDLSLDRQYVNNIRSRIEDNKSGQRVSLMGVLRNDDLAVRIKENQILAVPSFYEGFGMVYLEGMGFGLPAIGTVGGGAREIITHGCDGFLIEPGDSAALTGCLQKLVTDRNRLAEMSLNALKRFKEHPTWQMSCEKILKFMVSLRSGSVTDQDIY